MKTIGLVATFKGGLSSLRQSGQDERVIQNYFQIYAKHFDRLYYFSYFDERIEDFTSDPVLLEKVRIFPKKSRLPPLLYAFWMPFTYAKAFRSCSVFRIFQSIGILPLWRYFFRPPRSLVTYGYRYAQFARVEKKSFLKVCFIQCTEWLALRMATVMLVTTPELYSYVSARRRERTVVLIPNGVDAARFKSAEKVPTDSVSKKIHTLLFVGRFEKQKNLHALIQAAALAAKTIPLQLLWVGQGTLESELKALAQTHQVPMQILPPMPHHRLADVMRDADLFTLVSWTEGHPKVLLEAMASGLACVVSNCAGNRDMVIDGETGLICDPADIHSIADAITKVLSDTEYRYKMGHKGSLFVQKGFSLPVWVNRETTILQRLSEGTWPGAMRKRGRGFTQWLDYSIRRRLLDKELNRNALALHGRVLEIGGGHAIQRGRFVRPLWQCESWTSLNISAAAKPDVLGDVHALPFQTHSFDTLVCLEVIEYLEYPHQALQEMRRILMPGGVLLLSWPLSHPHDHPLDQWRFTEADMRRLCTEANFKIEQITRQGNGLTAIAHRIKWNITQIRDPILRQLMAAMGFMPVQFLYTSGIILESLGFLGSFTTGFVCIARA